MGGGTKSDDDSEEDSRPLVGPIFAGVDKPGDRRELPTAPEEDRLGQELETWRDRDLFVGDVKGSRILGDPERSG
jgi:hypothetical protein